MRTWLGISVFVLSVSAVYAQSNLVFPQMVVGGGYETVIQIANEVESDNTILIEVFHGWLAGASKGVWMFDFADFDLTGSGLKDGDSPDNIFGVRGNWLGQSFQFTRRIQLSDNASGMMVFIGASAGQETNDNRRITGKVTTIGADGQLISVNDFSAFHLYGAPPTN